MAKLSSLSGTLGALVTKAEAQIAKSDKVLTEVKALRKDFDDLRASLEDVEIPAEATASLEALDARLETLGGKLGEADDVNPDVVPPTS